MLNKIEKSMVLKPNCAGIQIKIQKCYLSIMTLPSMLRTLMQKWITIHLLQYAIFLQYVKNPQHIGIFYSQLQFCFLNCIFENYIIYFVFKRRKCNVF
jgi:hypothetical protein